ncbi:TonB-dependent receptor [Gilvimarinus sp. SDUM040013]|uniref:TonB-dependent receptor n=1 Tax=Gilvimarinus gilvus TaxID=3058038 RepID=A0ABU4RXT9_9GAMM|nr:TonB-dependent receptor [Gilvimarinus sp. SDUM040013]MDO3386629.1 TonB-dependent receptor [Gilvimarinus sp. SDUM040013]MDX6849484.1 TonB-dependent receptor [Gilvimarinus sp. SDUM040013]
MSKYRLLPLMIAMASSGHLYAQDAPPSADSGQTENLEEVIVKGVRQAELNARERERNKDAFSSIIATDDVGDFADQNVAESLQRLPGITLQKSEGEGKFVTVRGLGPGFVSVSMNGNELASAGADSRAVALDSLPSDILSSIEVIKALTPDMDLNSIGGTVNVNTISAFDRKKDTVSLKVQGNYQSYKEEINPKVSLSGSHLFADDTIGVGYSLSHEDRSSVVYQVQHHSDSLPRYVTPDVSTLPEDYQGDTLLIPFRYEARQEDAERTRSSGSLDLGFRPNENSEYYAKFSYTKYDDLDTALREYYRFGQAGSGDIVHTDSASGLFGLVDTDLQQQFFIQDGTSETTAMSFGGENNFGDGWTVDYSYAYSLGEWTKPDGRRVQFRARDLPMLGVAGPGYIQGQVVAPDVLEALTGSSSLPQSGGYGGLNGYQDGQRLQENLLYDNIFIEDSFREDELNQVKLDLKKEFADSDFLNYIKFGVTAKERQRDRNKDRWSVVPGDFTNGCEGDEECLQFAGGRLGDFATFTPAHPDIQHDFITLDAAEYLLDVTTPIAKYTDPLRTGQDSVKDDYTLSEDTAAAYFMGEFQISDNSSLIAGVRWAQTEFSSTGNLSIRNDRFEVANEATVLDIAVPMEGASSKYDDFFPSLHYRYEPREDILVRASLWTSFTRPSFNQARAYASFDGRVEVCNDIVDSPNYGECSDSPTDIGAQSLDDLSASSQNFYVSPDNVINLGNPTLTAMTSTNFDTSISWYASEDLYVQAAFFYKDIADFIVDVSGVQSSFEDMPVTIPVDQISEFYFAPNQVYNDVNLTTNGENAKVYGIELSYSQYFPLGLFVQSNMTLIDSEANVGDTIRAEEIQLPNQADTTVNLTVGWENDDFSLRLISNYRSKVLERIGSCSKADIAADTGAAYPENCADWADVYDDDTFGLDFKATYQVTDDIKLYFDAINLTEDKSFKYFRGNQYSRGNMLFESEDYGTSYQVGINVKFM